MTLRPITSALALAIAAVPAAAVAQTVPQPQSPAAQGIRLDVAATGEVRRAPDIVVINAGIVTRAPRAEAALADNATRMNQVRAALRRAGVAERDIQTSNISLNQEMRYVENAPPELVGYTASNQLSVRFRDIAQAGRIIDALVAAGANQINGPSFEIADVNGAMDEARQQALTVARTRAELYARALGSRVVRIVHVSESGPMLPSPVPVLRMQEAAADTSIAPGEQSVGVTLNVTFELAQPSG